MTPAKSSLIFSSEFWIFQHVASPFYMFKSEVIFCPIFALIILKLCKSMAFDVIATFFQPHPKNQRTDTATQKKTKITNLSNLQHADTSVFRVFALLARSFVYLRHNQSPNNYWTFQVKKKFLFFQLARQLRNVSLQSSRETLLILNEALRGLWRMKHSSLREKKNYLKNTKKWPILGSP